MNGADETGVESSVEAPGEHGPHDEHESVEHDATAAGAIEILERIEAESGASGNEAPRMAVLWAFGEMVRLRVHVGESVDELAATFGLIAIARELLHLRADAGMESFEIAYRCARFIEQADERAAEDEDPDGCAVKTHVHCVRAIAFRSWRSAVHTIGGWLGHVDESGTGTELMGIFVERLGDRLACVRAGEAVWS